MPPLIRINLTLFCIATTHEGNSTNFLLQYLIKFNQPDPEFNQFASSSNNPTPIVFDDQGNGMIADHKPHGNKDDQSVEEPEHYRVQRESNTSIFNTTQYLNNNDQSPNNQTRVSDERIWDSPEASRNSNSQNNSSKDHTFAFPSRNPTFGRKLLSFVSNPKSGQNHDDYDVEIPQFHFSVSADDAINVKAKIGLVSQGSVHERDYDEMSLYQYTKRNANHGSEEHDDVYALMDRKKKEAQVMHIENLYQRILGNDPEVPPEQIPRILHAAIQLGVGKLEDVAVINQWTNRIKMADRHSPVEFEQRKSRKLLSSMDRLDTMVERLKKQRVEIGYLIPDILLSGSKRHLLDTFGDSLRFVNRLYSIEYGRKSRKVPAHMPHMIDKQVIQELQKKLSEKLKVFPMIAYILFKYDFSLRPTCLLFLFPTTFSLI